MKVCNLPFCTEDDTLDGDGLMDADHDPWHVEDKEHEDGDNQDDREVAVFPLLTDTVTFHF